MTSPTMPDLIAVEQLAPNQVDPGPIAPQLVNQEPEIIDLEEEPPAIMIIPSTTGNPLQQRNEEVARFHQQRRAQTRRENERRRHEAANEMTPEQQAQVLAPRLQRMLIQGAEDIGLIEQMLNLKEETVSYMLLFARERKLAPPFPIFYETTVFYLYKLALKRGFRPIYLHYLSGVVKQRLKDYNLPNFGNSLSLQDIVAKYKGFEMSTIPGYEDKPEAAWRCFELVLGEAYQYVQWHCTSSNPQNVPPKSLNFLIKFCILFHDYGKPAGSNEPFYNIAFSRLTRNTPQVHHAYFEHHAQALQTHLRNPFLAVSFQ